MSKVILTKNQVEMIENHRNSFETLMQKRYWSNCPTSIDDLSVEDVLSAFFDGYEIEKKWYDAEDALKLQGDVGHLLLKSNRSSWVESKESSYPLYFQLQEDYKVSVGFTLDQMKLVRNYLNHKIEYLEKASQ